MPTSAGYGRAKTEPKASSSRSDCVGGHAHHVHSSTLDEIVGAFNQLNLTTLSTTVATIASNFSTTASDFQTNVVNPINANITALNSSPFATLNTTFDQANVRLCSCARHA